ncbi:MAG TPA: MarR family transcriptional regulator [Actinomycetota bacterium]
MTRGANAREDVGVAVSAGTDVAEELAELVPRLYRLLRIALDEEEGVPSLEQLRVLHRIDAGLHHVSALAAARQMRMSAVTAILDAAFDHGWVVRKPDPDDRRRVFVDLTPEGRSALRRGRRFVRKRMAAILQEYAGPSDELAAAVSMLAAAVNDYDALRGVPQGAR